MGGARRRPVQPRRRCCRTLRATAATSPSGRSSCDPTGRPRTRLSGAREEGQEEGGGRNPTTSSQKQRTEPSAASERKAEREARIRAERVRRANARYPCCHHVACRTLSMLSSCHHVACRRMPHVFHFACVAAAMLLFLPMHTRVRGGGREQRRPSMRRYGFLGLRTYGLACLRTTVHMRVIMCMRMLCVCVCVSVPG